MVILNTQWCDVEVQSCALARDEKNVRSLIADTVSIAKLVVNIGAFKWQRILWKCWQTHTRYSEELYEAAPPARQPFGGALRPRGTGQKPLQIHPQEILTIRLADPLRGELSDPAHGTRGLQTLEPVPKVGIFAT